MAKYLTHGLSVVTAATVDHAVFGVWNPSATKRIKVEQIHLFTVTALAVSPVLRRTTARGTPGSTVTPTSVNELEQVAAPPSGFLLDLAAYTVQPTLAASAIIGAQLGAAIGAGIMWQFPEAGLEIPAGQGIALTSAVAALFPASRISVIVED